MQAPKISIIMSVYNDDLSCLEKSLISILTQEFTDFEFIIINDASNYKVSSFLKKYAESDNRIILLNNPRNIGLTKSLNIGIKKSKGSYIARMDGDDISLPHRLQDQLHFLSDNNYDLIASDYELIDTDGDFISSKYFKFPVSIKKRMIKSNPLVHSTLFGKRKVFKELYNETFKKAQDYEFLLRIIGKGYTIGNLSKICLRYRMNSMGISFTDPKKQEWSAIKARILAIRSYGYNKLYLYYILRSFFIFLLPFKLKILLRR